MPITDAAFADLLDTRVHDPGRIAAALAVRRRRTGLAPDGVLFIVAADHPARGALAVGGDRTAMADRRRLLDRLALALDHPRVDGVLGSADVLEDLVVLGLLDDRVAVGTMNRGGLMGARWEIDDRMTAYDAEHIDDAHLDGGKVLLRLDDDDAGTAATLEACGRAVTELAERRLMAMVEPLPYRKDAHGRAVAHHDVDRLVQAASVASGLGSTSAYTWLKVPAGAGVERVMEASTCPSLILGGPLGTDATATLASWEQALAHPHCRGLVIGRSLLFPADGDVAATVVAAADLVDAKAKALR
ncbi:MAG TPA: deoxyribose-phosphate aldolase [Acidimicrobiales bacterium]